MGLLRDTLAPPDDKSSAAVDRLVICSLCGLSYPTRQANSIANRRLLIGSVLGALTLPVGFAVFDSREVQTTIALISACLIGGLFGAFAATWDWHALGHVLRMGVRTKNNQIVVDRVELAALFREGATSAWIVVLSIGLLYGVYAALGLVGTLVILVPVLGFWIARTNASAKRAIGTLLGILGIGIVATLLPQTLRFVFREDANLQPEAQLLIGVAAMMIVGGSLLRRQGKDR